MSNPWPALSEEDRLHAADFGRWLVLCANGDADRLAQLLDAVVVGCHTPVTARDQRENYLDTLWTLAGMQEVVTEATRSLVGTSRFYGATWEEVGKALGVTRQAAQQRYKEFR